MKSIRRANIVVVADSHQCLLLAARLRRMEVAQVTTVAGLDEARRLCQAGDTDACLVAFNDLVLDAAPVAESDAPGRDSGVPSLMLADAVTPYLRWMAHRCGYSAAVPAAIAPRLLYRRIGAALQRRRAAHRARRMPIGNIVASRSALECADLRKPTFH
jgi:DNA-binding response OmpR family regulator